MIESKVLFHLLWYD